MGPLSPAMPSAPGFSHEIVRTPGLRSHVATAGEGEPVVLLHGFPQHWWQWREVGAILAQRYHVICPDLRGAGWTEADDPGLERLTRMGDVVALLDELQIARARIVCHDMGAITGIQLAYDHPERVVAMASLSVPPGFMSFSPRLLPGLRHVPPLAWHRPGRSLRGLFRPPYTAQPMPAEVVDAYVSALERPEVDAAVRPLYRRMALPEGGRIARGEYRRRRLRPPTLVVFGASDEPYTEDLVRRLCGDVSRFADHVEFAFVPGASHFVTDDQPEAVANLLLDFFARTS